MSDGDYEVGYKRPPKHSQFKPGQSGNPKGFRNRKKDFAELLNDQLFKVVTIRENGKVRRVKVIEVIVLDLVRRAAVGEAKARRELLDLLKRYPRLAKPRPEIPWITKDMTPREAQKAYEATKEMLKDIMPDTEGWDWDPLQPR